MNCIPLPATPAQNIDQTCMNLLNLDEVESTLVSIERSHSIERSNTTSRGAINARNYRERQKQLVQKFNDDYNQRLRVNERLKSRVDFLNQLITEMNKWIQDNSSD